MTTPPEPDPPAADGTMGERVTALEHGQVSISGKLDQLLGMFSDHGTPGGAPEQERPEVNIAQEIRDGLAALAAQGKAPDPPAAPKPGDLAEQKPKAPVRRLTRALWGGDDG